MATTGMNAGIHLEVDEPVQVQVDVTKVGKTTMGTLLVILTSIKMFHPIVALSWRILVNMTPTRENTNVPCILPRNILQCRMHYPPAIHIVTANPNKSTTTQAFHHIQLIIHDFGLLEMILPQRHPRYLPASLQLQHLHLIITIGVRIIKGMTS